MSATADPAELKSILDDAASRTARLVESLRIADKEARIQAIRDASASPDFWNDQDAARGMMEEMKGLAGIVEPVRALEQRVSDNNELLEMAQEMDETGEFSSIAKDVQDLPQELERLETMALLSGPHDDEPCFFSIHTGAGGSDACEWAEMMLRMYTRYFEKKGWSVEELNFSPGEEAGIRGVELRVQGPFAFGHLKGEIGVHRLVRISPFSGRRETSFAAVDAVPDYQQAVEIDVEEKDLRVDRIHATGKGGQHVNKTASAVRLTHTPSNIVVTVQTERSQHRNLDIAMKILKSRLYQQAEAARNAAVNARNAAKSDNAWGSQIRNYVLNPYTMVKDARTACETGNIQGVLDGDLDPFVEAYLRWFTEQENQAGG